MPHVVVGVASGQGQVADLVLGAVLTGKGDRLQLGRVDQLVVDDRREALRHEQVGQGGARITVDRFVLRRDVLLRDDDQADLVQVHAARLLDVGIDLHHGFFNFVGRFGQRLGKRLRDLRIENFQILGHDRRRTQRTRHEGNGAQYNVPHSIPSLSWEM